MSRYTASFQYYPLKFKKPAGTSRGILYEKPSWLLTIRDNELGMEGIGEVSIIPGLSVDPEDEIEATLVELCLQIESAGDLESISVNTERLPSIKFGLETAIFDLYGGGKRILFDNAFSRGEKGIPINGLVWMEGVENMFHQAKEKIEQGYSCIKLKVGALDFEAEYSLLQRIRDELSDTIEIRLDANGGFEVADALTKLARLSKIRIHSIEQPIKPLQWEVMETLCKQSPIPIALDEELIGVWSRSRKIKLLDTILPQYIILKPSLLGGFAAADEWISLAEERDIKWWATSALESNIGLNAIAQWVWQKDTDLPQGLGTGGLYLENYPLPLEIKMGQLLFNA